MNNRLILILLIAALAACASNGDEQDNMEDVYLQLGVRYLGMNKLEAARENLALALKENSSNPHVHNALAFLYEKLNQPDNAKKHYETALELAPDDLGAQNNLGRFLCEHGEHENGMKLLTQASSNPLNEKQWMALTNAGRCQVAVGNKPLAENYFRQALLLNAAYGPALAEMQKIAYDKGDYWAAKGFLQRYLGVADHTEETLWFAILTERALGNKGLASEYRKLLLDKFPLSNEAKKITGISNF
ncbi:MAG: type IV pilus biogenesis/stability protein PilW [Methylobacter sp.]